MRSVFQSTPITTPRVRGSAWMHPYARGPVVTVYNHKGTVVVLYDFKGRMYSTITWNPVIGDNLISM